jgi:hypothetical protein
LLNIGPQKLFSATVISIVGTVKPAALVATSPAFVAQKLRRDRLRGECHLRLEIDEDQGMIAGSSSIFAGRGIYNAISLCFAATPW